MNRRIRLVFFTTLVAALVGAGVLYAQGPGRGLGFGHGRGPGLGGPGAMLPLRQLELTDAQQQQIRELMQQHRAAVQPIMERLRVAAEAQRAAVDAAPADEGRIRAAAQQVAEVQADLAVQRARLQSDIVALLTPEQQQRLQQLRAERQSRMEQRRQRMQQRLQPLQPRQPA
ncbi:MAG: Spy/CpxP family protein refolding chaperone [Acidobacteria bacterium]|nr:Spy/CpxP family protein refolding chaperone [Acidobacteriota bacterium]